MIEIPRVYQHSFTYVARSQSVTPVEAPSVASPQVPVTAERRKQHDRRKQKKKVVLERRLAPDRRGPLFKAEV